MDWTDDVDSQPITEDVIRRAFEKAKTHNFVPRPVAVPPWFVTDEKCPPDTIYFIPANSIYHVEDVGFVIDETAGFGPEHFAQIKDDFKIPDKAD